MTGSPADWAALARDEGLDPAEVRRVLVRYQAYCRYYAEGGRGEPLALEGWFRWYRLETASEGAGKTSSGCSVGPGAQGPGAISRPEAFLKVLAALAAVEAAA
jgi:hypothetical protein